MSRPELRSLAATILLAAIALSACASAESPTLSPIPTPWDAAGHRAVQLGERFVLKVGELVEMEVDEGTAALWFGEVRQDSRCPKDVVCVRAGDATVVLTGVTRSGESTVMEIVVDSKGTATGSFGGYSVTVLELLPYPVSSVLIGQDEYRATVVVTRAE